MGFIKDSNFYLFPNVTGEERYEKLWDMLYENQGSFEIDHLLVSSDMLYDDTEGMYPCSLSIGYLDEYRCLAVKAHIARIKTETTPYIPASRGGKSIDSQSNVREFVEYDDIEIYPTRGLSADLAKVASGLYLNHWGYILKKIGVNL